MLKTNQADIKVWHKGVKYTIGVERHFHSAVYFNCRNMIGGRKYKQTEINELALHSSTKKSVLDRLHRHWALRKSKQYDFLGRSMGAVRLTPFPDHYCIMMLTGTNLELHIWLSGRCHIIKGTIIQHGIDTDPVFTTSIPII